MSLFKIEGNIPGEKDWLKRIASWSDMSLFIEWFESNYMMLNQVKCHFLFSGHKYETLFVNE